MPPLSNPCCACLTAVAKHFALLGLAFGLLWIPRLAAGQTPSITGARDLFTGRPAAGGQAWATAPLDSASWGHPWPQKRNRLPRTSRNYP